MVPSPQLAPPGSSTYTSNTMSVGDGTWDTQRNTFLLPNLVGLNFDTMRYNGMGNRFRELPQYHVLIRGHGIVAAVTFLLIVPSAIMLMRFYDRRPGWHITLHIWLQVITVALTTVVFVLGWFAVGPDRSLTNPHHGIGLAIYVLVLVQAIAGWRINKRKKKAKYTKPAPMFPMLHHWFGRFIALLGLAQIPLGLTLYGSPLALFVLYTLAVFLLFMIYFVLEYRAANRYGYDDSGSYSSRSEIIESRHRSRSRLGGAAEAGAAGAALGALAGRHGNRSRSRSRTDVVGSRRHSRVDVYDDNEKYSDRDRRGTSWTDRLLQIGAIGGGVALAKGYLDRKRDRQNERDRERERDRHNAPLGGAHSVTDESDSRIDEVQSPSRRPTAGLLGAHRRSQSFSSISSHTTAARARRNGGHGLRDGVATLGAFGLLKDVFRRRREAKEQRRLDDLKEREMEDERIARANSGRYTGDNFPRRGGRRGSLTTSTDDTGTTDSALLPRPRYNHGLPPPIPEGAVAAGIGGAAAGTALADRNRRDHTTLGASNPVLSGAANDPNAAVLLPPPPPHDPQGILHHDSSGSQVYRSPGGRDHHRHSEQDAVAAGAAGAAAGLAAGEAGRQHNNRHSNGEGSVASPPVSVKVQMRNDGRHVTLRRLSEQEAAAEREARRRERHGKHHRRRGSGSEIESGGETWRRTEDRERQQAEEMRRQNERPSADQRAQGAGLVPPPPIGGGAGPTTSGVLGRGSAVGSPGTVTGTYDGTATEASKDYEDSRRRRRAERAQARQAAGRSGGGGVEFT
ncbi:MAG: hypothetical protein M1827_000965 [Pycnora praestabilis]|nr:MAG: hypothetical protein M1827_000965 [Pycnora praestabilis]